MSTIIRLTAFGWFAVRRFDLRKKIETQLTILDVNNYFTTFD